MKLIGNAALLRPMVEKFKPITFLKLHWGRDTIGSGADSRTHRK